MKNMILILKTDKEHVRDFLIKLRDYVNVLKQYVPPEGIENNFLKLTKYCIKKGSSAT